MRTFYCETHRERLTIEKAEDGWDIYTRTSQDMGVTGHCHLVAGFREIIGGSDPCGEHPVKYRRHGHPVFQTCKITVTGDAEG